MINLREDCGLHQLRVNQVGDDCQARFIRIHNRAFGERVNVSAEMKIFEALQKIFVENFLRAQVIDIRRAELHVLHVLNDLLQPRENREAAGVRVAPIENVERHARVLSAVDEVAVGHCHLVEVHHHGKVAFIKLAHENSSTNKKQS